jgi:hypothetical protein
LLLETGFERLPVSRAVAYFARKITSPPDGDKGHEDDKGHDSVAQFRRASDCYYKNKSLIELLGAKFGVSTILS